MSRSSGRRRTTTRTSSARGRWRCCRWTPTSTGASAMKTIAPAVRRARWGTTAASRPSSTPPRRRPASTRGWRGNTCRTAWRPAAADGGAARWDAIKEEYAERVEEFTARFTKNDFRKSILKRHVDSPLDIERRNPSFVKGSCCNGSTEPHQVGYYRPFHDYEQGRCPIERLYLAGDWVGVTGGAGGNAGG